MALIPNPTFGGTVQAVPYTPLARTWVAPQNVATLATDPNAWLSSADTTGAPHAGDALSMQHTGIMNIVGEALQGDRLSLGGLASGDTMTLNMSGQAHATLQAGNQISDQVNINVATADDTATVQLLDGGYQGGSNFDVNLGAGVTLQDDTHFDLTKSTAHISGPTSLGFINNAEVTLHQDAQLWTYTPVSGTGSMTVGDTQWGGAIAYFDKSVSSGQSINVVGHSDPTSIEGPPTPPTPSQAIVHDPKDFHASVNLDFGQLILQGVQASSYSLQKDLLSLYDAKGSVIDSLHVTSVGSPDPIRVYQSGFSILVDASAHPSGTLVPLHGVAI